MRVLVVEPGPHFSVQDVCAGWSGGFQSLGCDVVRLNFGDRLQFYSEVGRMKDGTFEKVADDDGAMAMAAKGIEVAAYEFWPDVIVVVSGFYVPTGLYGLLRSRRHKVVLLHTESPYEDERQLARAPLVDFNVLNDPTNLERFAEVAPSAYIPHAYDPSVHHPREAQQKYESDFCLVGTGYPSRVEFLEAVDWTGIDVALAGNWGWVKDTSPIRDFVLHPLDHCIDNTDAVDLYAATKASANLYRREAQRPELSAGWSMGPREVELAACGTFYLTEERGENREVLPFVPTFAGPGDFGDKLRWWLRRPEERAEVAAKARAAVADRTFTANAASLLRHLERI